MNPLETRSLPRGLWRFVPAPINEADESLRRWLSGVPLDDFPWKPIRWLTETTPGIACGLLALAICGWAWRARQKPAPAPPTNPQNLFWRGAAFALCLGASDLLASAIKLVIGRLKPHVTFYNPNFTPALSCPSNHAFNTAFALSLAWQALPPPSRRRHQALFAAAAAGVMAVGLTRVMFGQHYPLDVCAGWLLGGLGGRWAAPVYGWLASLRTKRN